MIEYPLVPRDVCTDQWWPDVDDVSPDECADQRHPPDMPDVMGWDRLSANPGRDVSDIVRRLAAQAGIYMVYGQSHPKASSDHVTDYTGRGWQVESYLVDEMHSYHTPHEVYAMDFAADWKDPYVETPQTRADILAWKRKQNTGPSTEKWVKRGRKKK